MTADQKREARIAGLAQTFNVIESARSAAEHACQVERAKAFARALALIDAIECVEMRAEPFASERDAWIVDRLRAIAIERDIFGERRTDKQEGGETAAQ